MDKETIAAIEERLRKEKELSPDEPLIAYSVRRMNEGLDTVTSLARKFDVPRSQVEFWVIDQGFRRHVHYAPVQPPVI